MTKINDIIAAETKRLEMVLRSAFEAGREAARRDMLNLISGEVQHIDPLHSSQSADAERKRAPKGLVGKLVARVLFENHIIGSKPQDICDAAITEHEKMITASTVRGELRRGKEDGRYVEDNGSWRLSGSEYRVQERKQTDLGRR